MTLLSNLKIGVFCFLAFILIPQMSFSQQGKVIINQDEKIAILLEAKKQMEPHEDANGKYKLQIYSGNRSTAEATQRDYNSNFTEWKATLEYEAPNFKIWVGSFTTRLESENALKKIKSKFPNAFVFKPKK